MEANLRIILLVIGIIVIAGVVVDEIIRNKKRNKTTSNKKDISGYDYNETMTVDRFDFTISERTHEDNGDNEFTQEVIANKTKDDSKPLEIIGITIIARNNNPISGDMLMQAARSAGLNLGPGNILYRHQNGDTDKDLLFNVTSIKEPGNFDFSSPALYETDGLCLFFNLAQASRPLLAYEEMLTIGRTLASTFGANLCNLERDLISLGEIETMRTRVEDKIREKSFAKVG